MFLFAENRWSNQSQNNWTMPPKWITTGWAQGTMLVDYWVPSLSQIIFQCSGLDFYSQILCHIELTFLRAISICASSGKKTFFFEWHIFRAYMILYVCPAHVSLVDDNGYNFIFIIFFFISSPTLTNFQQVIATRNDNELDIPSLFK